MSDETKTFITVVICLSVVVCTLTISLTFYNLRTTQYYIDNGYEQTTLEGQNGTFWVKVDESKYDAN